MCAGTCPCPKTIETSTSTSVITEDTHSTDPTNPCPSVPAPLALLCYLVSAASTNCKRAGSQKHAPSCPVCEAKRALRGCTVSNDGLASLTRFECQDKWRWGTTQTADRCTWVAVMLEYIFTFGFQFQASFLNKAMTVGALTRRFLPARTEASRHCVPCSQWLTPGRGFKALGGLPRAESFARIMVACLTIAEQFSQLPLAKRVKPSAAIVPLWDKTV